MSTLRRLISLCTPPAPRRAPAPLPRVPAGRPRPSVLIVEDHAEVASYLRRALEQLQAFTEVSAEGETAVTMAEMMHFDLIILDILLPGMNGFEVFRAIRRMVLRMVATVDPGFGSLAPGCEWNPACGGIKDE